MFDCKSCGRAFVSEGALAQHRSAVHHRLHECDTCGRFFATVAAREQHSAAKHGLVCHDCGRSFRTARSLEQHVAATHAVGESTEPDESYDDWTPNAPSGLDGLGEWVGREDFAGHKSFGFFECGTCDACWLSAHAFRNTYRQKCKACNAWSQPRYMWHNYDTGARDRDPSDPMAKDRPHHADKCEACRAGVCTSNGGDFYY
jgi:hypothetical protein